MKGYAAWNYWDHRIVLLTANHHEVQTAVDSSRTANRDIQADWFGIEAVDDMDKVPGHLILSLGDIS